MPFSTSSLMAASSTHLLMACFLLLCNITVTLSEHHIVGDSEGWNVGTANYTSWSASKQFQVGDIILFQYNRKFHNVIQVTRASYHSCNTSSPLVIHSTGNDSIVVKSRGHYFFVCGFPGHCDGGQKVDIRVLHDLPPSPTSPVSTLPTLGVDSTNTKAGAPSSGHASTLHAGRHCIALASCLSALLVGLPVF